MKSIWTVLPMALLALGCLSHADAPEERPKPEILNEKEVLARLRLLTQEELEISRQARERAAGEKVRDFATWSASGSEELDKKLTDLARDLGVDVPPGSKPLFQRLEAIKKLRGEAFDVDYLILVIDFHGEHVALYERLAKVATSDRLREFARKALALERAHLKAAQNLAAPSVPEVKPCVR
jgi:predicted outer membrane protein